MLSVDAFATERITASPLLIAMMTTLCAAILNGLIAPGVSPNVPTYSVRPPSGA